MLNIGNKKEVTKAARALKKALSSRGVELSHGETLNMLAQMHGFKDINAWKSMFSKSSAQTSAPEDAQYAITDVDFFSVHAVIYQGRCYRVEWREEKILAYLGKENDESYEDWVDRACLVLYYEEDGLVWEEHVSLRRLSSLVWSPREKAFVDPEGETWRFFLETEFGVNPGAGGLNRTSA